MNRINRMIKRADANCFLTIAYFLFSFTGSAQIITTIAGTGTAGYTGDGGLATNAELNFPVATAIDGAGNIYIADYFNSRIRKINPAGFISTVAGTGVAGYSGDGGLAINARITNSNGIAVDAAGNLYISDQYNYCVRKVDASGIISTYAGTGVQGYSGDGGSAIVAQMGEPFGLAMDATGNLYIAEANNHRIRKVDNTGIISTFAGTSTLGFSGDGGPAASAALYNPYGVGVSGSGDVYIADSYNSRIRVVNGAGVISTFAGNGSTGFGGDGGTALNAMFDDPRSVAIDAGGNVYVADETNNRIRKINTSGIISTCAGMGFSGYGGDGGNATVAQINHPFGVTVDAGGTIYISDNQNKRVRKVSAVTGIEESEGLLQARIYPNPCSDKLVIRTAKEASQKECFLFSADGKQMNVAKTGSEEYDVSALSAGSYFLQLKTETGTLTKKIIIER